MEEYDYCTEDYFFLKQRTDYMLYIIYILYEYNYIQYNNEYILYEVIINYLEFTPFAQPLGQISLLLGRLIYVITILISNLRGSHLLSVKGDIPTNWQEPESGVLFSQGVSLSLLPVELIHALATYPYICLKSKHQQHTIQKYNSQLSYPSSHQEAMVYFFVPEIAL